MAIARPPAAYDIPLSDENLAKVGLLAMHEAQASELIWIASKALRRLDVKDWIALRKDQKLNALIRKAIELAKPLDPTLTSDLQRFEDLRGTVQGTRNAILHGQWLLGPPPGGQIVIRDWLRERVYTLDDLALAVAESARLAGIARIVLHRVAELIADGVLVPAPREEAGPRYRLDEQRDMVSF